MGFFQTSGILNRRGFFGGTAKAFSPTDIAGLQLWLDATTGLFDSASGGSAVTTDGSAVARWEDQSGNGRHFKQATSNNRPVLKALIQNNKNIIRFDGSNDFLEMDTAFNGLTSASYYVVLKVDADPPTVQTMTGHPVFFLSGGILASHFPWTDGNIYDNTLTTSRKTVGNPTRSLALFNLYNVDSTSGHWTSRLNKSQLFTTSTNTIDQQGKKLGLNDSQATFYYFDGDMAEIICFNSILSASDRGMVEDYLYAKWGI
jgi:hypothetical protein